MAAYNSDQYGVTKSQPGAGPVGDLKVLFGTIEIGTAHSAADTINFFTAPKGFTPLYGYMVGDDIDTGTETLEIDIGIDGDSTKYLDSGVISGDTIANEKITVGIKIPLCEELMTVKPTQFTVDTDIIGTVVAVAQAGGTGTLTLWMVGMFQDPRVAY